MKKCATKKDVAKAKREAISEVKDWDKKQDKQFAKKGEKHATKKRHK